ncbi:tetratricopeptide repeat protein [Terasakiella sp. A23]|uniref:tetratricopeptide repeat protein n=1 Tax=Terasakiella sp. FCG-A23 TaxID=3080561 RepID=UPI0029532A79|nr:tetratricopeptide repeat protein [Terasakiella sp. A23]MDV7340369.1 tetratricopeptide repeat protein [Terasakiella sp. A23]
MKKIFTMGLALCAMGALSACGNTSDQTVQETPKEVQDQIDQLIRLGDKTRQSGDYRNALTFYQRAFSLDANNRTTLFLLAETSRRLGDVRAAEGLYANALARTPNDVEILTRYGNALVELDKLPQAIIQFEKALDVNPDDERVLSSLGVAYDMQGRHDEAQTLYQKSIQIAPDNLSVLNNYALSLALSGEYDKAITEIGTYANDPQAPARLRLNLALIYGLKGDMKMAAQIAGQILDKESVENNLKIYSQLKNLSQAARKKAILGK